MATYDELFSLRGDSGLLNKVTVAVVIAAQGVMEDVANFPTPTADTVLQADRLLWAARAFNSPRGEAGKVWMSALAANKDATLAQIQGASDVALQNNVNAAVDLLAVNDKPSTGTI